MKGTESRMPSVSVVMSVFNGEEHLSESIESVLSQSFKDFEFIIINDGSTDSTESILDFYARKDSRIKIVHQANSGLARALNRAVRLSKADLIARQDADDISLFDRLEKQLELFRDRRNLVLCGTWFEEIDEGGGTKLRTYPFDDKTLRVNIKYANNFCHPSVMFSKKAFWACGRYDDEFVTAQDFDLWIRISKYGNIANVPEKLLIKRIGFGGSVSWGKRKDKIKVVSRIFSKHFKNQGGLNIIKFVKFYFPLAIYGYIPEFVLRPIRKLRYR